MAQRSGVEEAVEGARSAAKANEAREKAGQ
jgi:hypothetical protein